MKQFRDLDEEEVEVFRKWARDNYKPYNQIKGVWHPVIQEECVKMNREGDITDFLKLGIKSELAKRN